MSEELMFDEEREETSTATPYLSPLTLDKLERSPDPEVRALAAYIRRLFENEIPHLEARIKDLEASRSETALNALLGITITLGLLSLVCFCSIPLIGIVLAGAAIFSGICYLMGRRKIES